MFRPIADAGHVVEFQQEQMTCILSWEQQTVYLALCRCSHAMFRWARSGCQHSRSDCAASGEPNNILEESKSMEPASGKHDPDKSRCASQGCCRIAVSLFDSVWVDCHFDWPESALQSVEKIPNANAADVRGHNHSAACPCCDQELYDLQCCETMKMLSTNRWSKLNWISHSLSDVLVVEICHANKDANIGHGD